MSKTVIGIFENSAKAQEAKSYLLANGFNSENVDMSNGTTHTDTTGTSGEEGFGDRIGNFFSNLFEDEDEASAHTTAAKTGTTVTVHSATEDEALQAVQVLDNFGAVDVNEYGARSGGVQTSNNGAIPVIEEELQVGKRDVETGGVRLRSRIVERPVEESIRLREEHVSIDRTPVNRVASEADFANFKEGTIEEIEHAEKPVVAKEARIVEEVSLGKKVTEREETINDTVRHTEVDTENLPGSEKTAAYSRENDEEKY